MPKIRDLGISHIPFARNTKVDRGYLMCQPTIPPSDPEGAPDEECHPTPPKCHPTYRDNPCNPTKPPDKPGKEKQEVRGLPDHAVIQLKQQLRQQISGQLHS